MCLALPARVVEKRADYQAIVDLGGVRKEVSLALVPEAQVGDYVIVHVGFAIGMIDPEEAHLTLALMSEMQQFHLLDVRREQGRAEAQHGVQPETTP